MVRMNAIPAYCVYVLYRRRWWNCSISLLCVHGQKLYIIPVATVRLQCVHGQKTLYIPVVKVRLQYQPTVSPWTKKLYLLYLGRRWEYSTYQLLCVHGTKTPCIIIIPAAKVRVQYQPTVCPWTKSSLHINYYALSPWCCVKALVHSMCCYGNRHTVT